MDRVLAPVTWLAAALAVLVLLSGPELIGADVPPEQRAGAGPSGEKVFADAGCGSCHAFEAAGATGSVGPDLDAAAPGAERVTAIVTDGSGSMPAFGGDLSEAEIAAVARFVAGGGRGPAATPPPGRVTTFRTDEGPDGITVAGDEVWVASATAGTLQRFDAATGEPAAAPVRVGRQPDSPVVADGVAWVVLTGDDAVVRIGNDGPTRIGVGARPEELAVGDDAVWVTNSEDGTVSRIGRASGRLDGDRIRVGARPLGIAFGAGAVWVTSYDNGTLTRIDPATGTPSEPIAVGDRPRGVAVGEGFVWVANAGDGTVSRVDPSAMRVVGTSEPVGDDPRDIAVGEGAVWVAAAGDDVVQRIDPATGEAAQEPIEVGDDPIGIAAGAGAVFTADFRADTVTRIAP